MSVAVANVEVTEQGLSLVGDFVYETVPSLVNEGDIALIDHSASEVVINCSGVNRLDSAGVSLLLEWSRTSSQHNKSIKLIAFPEQAKSLIDTFKLNELFRLA